MPHTSDRRRRDKRASITLEPARLAADGLSERGLPIQPSDGQRALQSVLLQCFTYPGAWHPWDPREGRRHLSGLFTYYGSWVSPRADRIAIGTTVAARFCSYLLPYVRPTMSEDDPDCAGIPGLRLEAFRPWGYRLRHLPTDTWLEIHDRAGRYSSRSQRTQLERELRMHREKEEHSYDHAWRCSKLTEVEGRWAPVWQPQPYTDILSAVFSAMSVLLHNPDCGFPCCNCDGREIGSGHLALTPSPRSEAHSLLAWCDGIRPGRLGHYLGELGLDMGGEVRGVELSENMTLLTYRSSTVELYRRAACLECDREPAFRPVRQRARG